MRFEHGYFHNGFAFMHVSYLGNLITVKRDVLKPFEWKLVCKGHGFIDQEEIEMFDEWFEELYEECLEKEKRT